ncbi:phage tail protein [Mesorhizobium sp. C280B]|uniref:phage tail protein n=1 Tax=unclassified Mesorhizobium TaxID=325217 RepID=UPI0003CE76A4|nr:phage tail protein [Mesorhizobium sp. LSJC280B00]ESW92921.1 hypothetical protein X772_02885 [Mesorhizobium sp. LSJC280B00]
MADHLLPGNATALERSVSESLDRLSYFGPTIDAGRGLKYQPVLPASFAPWIVAEYGLGPISSYFNDANMLIAAGIPWQRIRGTPLAVATALAWLQYIDLDIDDQKAARRNWNRYQIGMGRVPDIELPVLLDAEYLAGLSDPARSFFFRGWHGYDFRTLEWAQGRWGDAIWGDDSGARVDGGSVKWSHGEDDAGSIVAGQPQRITLGVDVHEGDELEWGDFPWDAPGISWDGVEDVAAFKAFLMLRLPVYVGFYNSGGEAIGYRRPLSFQDVTSIDAVGETITLQVECRTGFGDGEGQTAATCALVFRAGNADAAKPGKLWLAPDEIVFDDGFYAADMKIGSVPLDFTFRRTVRQHVTLTLEI